MAALLPVLTVALTVLIASTAVTPAAASPYSSCPLPTVLVGCTCSDDDPNYGPNVTVSAPDDIEACITSLPASGLTTLYQLTVEGYPDLKLTDNLIHDVLVERLVFDDNVVTELSDEFIGDSRNFTKLILFNDGTLVVELPSLHSDVLETLQFENVVMNDNLHLRKNAFSGTPALERLNITAPYGDTGVLTIHRGAMKGATKLQSVWLRRSLHLRWGALHFTAPDLELLHLGRAAANAIEAGPGSIAGIPAGAKVEITGVVNGGWQSSKFFNILRGGASIKSIWTIDCGCDLAWIRYSSFIDQVDIDCWVVGGGGLDIPLSEYDLSHCTVLEKREL